MNQIGHELGGVSALFRRRCSGDTSSARSRTVDRGIAPRIESALWSLIVLCFRLWRDAATGTISWLASPDHSVPL